MPYSRSWAFNVGARHARGQILVFHDNDLLMPARYAQEIIRVMDHGYCVARLQRFIFYLNRADTKAVFPMRQIPGLPVPELVRQNCEGGTLAIERNTYFTIGGHDESFLGWGGEDNEMFDRCRTVACYPYGYLPFLHLHHSPQPRTSNSHQFTDPLRARLAIPAEERIADLAGRPFGAERGPYGFHDIDAPGLLSVL
jgi:glycosyltransferase involved in cell wall biosynthesis